MSVAGFASLPYTMGRGFRTRIDLFARQSRDGVIEIVGAFDP
jgi:hypothetical protein